MHLPKLFKNKMEQTIEIKCAGHTTVDVDELYDLQGNLKSSNEERDVKLQNSMIEFGFSFPIFYWEDTDGRKWIIDAHRRKANLIKLRERGWTIPRLPADPVYAESKTQAKQKLLLLNSQYGEITKEGWDEFTGDVPMDDIEDMLEIPGLEDAEVNEVKATSIPSEKEPETFTCSNCGHINTI